MYLDRQTAREQAAAINAFLESCRRLFRNLLGRTPQTKTVFIDTETTGLKPGPDQAEIIEIAAITENTEGSVEYWCVKVAPQHIHTAHPKALEINGYTPEAWTDAWSPTTVAPLIAEKLEGAIVIGHNVKFDIRFIRALLSSTDYKDDLDHVAEIDTQDLARSRLKPTGLRSISLVNCRKWLGWSTEGAHTAMQDTEDCRRLYHTLSRSGPLQNRLWKWLGPRRMRRANKQ